MPILPVLGPLYQDDSGKGDMQLDNGTVLTYKLDGKVEGGVYTVNLVDRTGELEAKVGTAPGGESHRPRDHLVRVAKRHPLANEVVGEVGRRRETLARRLAHPADDVR